MIEIENLTKTYGKHAALDKINFKVNKGEILGFLGPNGAGKSTTMNILTGYISATEGTVKVDGIDIMEDPMGVKKKIGYLPELPPLYMDMTVEEYLKFVCKIKKVEKSLLEQHLDEIMQVVKIKEVRGRLIKNLSKGYKQRVGLAQALIGNPEVLILDEPTVGLDPKQIIEIRNLIKEVGKNHTIILSSHILPEVSAVCDRVLIINKGRIVAEGTPEELSKMFTCSNKIQLRIKGNKEKVKQNISLIDEVDNFKMEGSKEEGTFDIVVTAKKDMDIREKLFYSMTKIDSPILSMKNVDPTLEEIFLQVTTGNGEESKNVSSIK